MRDTTYRPYILQLCRDEVIRKAQSADIDIEMRSPKKRRRNPFPEGDDEIIKPISEKNGQRSGLSPAESSGSSSKQTTYRFFHLELSRTNATDDIAPQTVSCPACQKQVPMAKINQHLDDGCKSPTPTDFEVGSSTTKKSKGKQKQDWQKLFSAAESSNGTKGKGKAKYVQCRSIYILNAHRIRV